MPNQCTLTTKLTAARFLPQPQTNAAHFPMHQIVITTTAANAAAISITISTSLWHSQMQQIHAQHTKQTKPTPPTQHREAPPPRWQQVELELRAAPCTDTHNTDVAQSPVAAGGRVSQGHGWPINRPNSKSPHTPNDRRAV